MFDNNILYDNNNYYKALYIHEATEYSQDAI